MWTAADGLVAYDVRQGDRRGTDLDFFDYTYDGSVEMVVPGAGGGGGGGSRLVGGLGQLTDGDEGPSNIRQHDAGGRRRGYEWVGWKRPDSDDRHSVITAHRLRSFFWRGT